ncbi:hypothetical protein IE81DRAFT_324508 [Ceraceosorus guamensis]|uniref:CCHC-type domain-containing protein n=1 Tax=Ceraceosorus guamensis TaxID=1522189 RepID=A0A316VV64_9BASI|nr:hypothetical protein IE81DRAFT_324508 [Ceraceosorus guamensis]PWN41516.1 hypothetical protein IE81DRAFT_324508 [Ceraceosorus guamensis]
MVRRRSCFVCGQLGHLAEACGSTERLCFNCSKPGHESSACPEERTVATKQCYACGESGHIKSACPNPTSASAAVATATGAAPGVVKSESLAKRVGGVNGQNKKAAAACYTCGGPHLARQCPQGFSAKPAAANADRPCYNCGVAGHRAKDCTSEATEAGAAAASKAPPRRQRGAPGTCYGCGQPGHVRRECPAHADPPAAPTSAAVMAI